MKSGIWATSMAVSKKIHRGVRLLNGALVNDSPADKANWRQIRYKKHFESQLAARSIVLASYSEISAKIGYSIRVPSRGLIPSALLKKFMPQNWTCNIPISPLCSKKSLTFFNSI